MGHAGAAQCFDQRLFNDTVLDVEGQLAGTLLRRTPANTMSQARNVFDFISLYPFALFGDGGRTMMHTLGHGAHAFYFMRIGHSSTPLSLIAGAAGRPFSR
ncbi:hypothetical protein SDC9_200985 [bioreactor metagenome]|uniref:Uncharacterized protein n=1 Tax=bioreactor metagenome TaxID=1076179 RepID=A0A645IPR5_9ZZZZ